MTTRNKYLNNKELLKEIHKSKCSYCEFIEPHYHQFDAVVENFDDIFKKEVQEEARKNKADRLSREAYQEALEEYEGPPSGKPRLIDNKVDPDSLDPKGLVYRVTTYEHIPEDPERKKNPRKESEKYVKLNFVPFKHYIITDQENKQVKEVGRSHSKNGEFCQTHGAMTDKLARMFMLLVERYSQRSNWRGYCVDEETEALTQRGWLGIDDITENDTILSCSNERLVWSKIESIYRGEFNGLLHQITNQHVDMLVTPHHKLLTKRGLIPVELIKENDQIILLGDSEVGVENEVYSDSFVELAAWTVTEGNYEYTSDKKHLKRICLWQNEGPYAERIRECLNLLGYGFSEKTTGKNICFAIQRQHSKEFHDVLPQKNLSMEFILNLTSKQRSLFLETLVDGDGWRTGLHKRYCQKDEQHVDIFQALCALEGHRSNKHFALIESYHKQTSINTVNVYSKRKNKTNGESLNFHGGKRNGRNGKTQLGRGKENHPNVPTTKYQGMVWCPETEYGCFVARRNGIVHLTGNTYIEEMKGQSLLQLSSMGLQFNEAKSNNPFAYYTQALTHSFTRVLNTEKKNQNVRDEVLIDKGLMPSFSKQIEFENQVRKMREDAANSGDQQGE